MSDLPEASPYWELATNVGALITVMEQSAGMVLAMAEGLGQMAAVFRENDLPTAADPLDSACEALAGHADCLRQSAGSLEPIVEFFHTLDNVGAQEAQ